MHGYDERMVHDVPVDARRVQIVARAPIGLPDVRIRRTFREQPPGVLERHQRRTPRPDARIGVVAKELAGRGTVRVLTALPDSRQSGILIAPRF